MALPLFPKFCHTHRVIHICNLMDPTAVSKSAQDQVDAKVRRLLGKQTEEELAEAQNKQAKEPEGSLQQILANAKKRINEQKKQLNPNSVEIENLTKIDESDISSKMASLRQKIMGDSQTIDTDKNSPIKKKNSPTIKGKIKPIDPELLKKAKQKKTIVANTSATAKNNVDMDGKEKNTFTLEETKEMIQEAVKLALEEVGVIKKTKTTGKNKIKSVSTNNKK